METPTDGPGFQITQLTAINIAKITTIFCLLTLAAVYGVHDTRQVIYLALHISYCVWWIVEQGLFPQRRQQIFTEKAGVAEFISVLLFVGVFYALPGFFAFTNPNPIAAVTLAIALPLYIFGSLINTGADVQKMAAKAQGAGLVKDGAWRSLRHVNYLGDLMRYTSFSVVAGSPWAFILPVVITLLYVQRIQQKEASMAAKYAEFETYRQDSDRLIPGIW